MLKILALVTEAFGGGGGISQYNRDLLTAIAMLDETESVLVLPRFGRNGACPVSVQQLSPQPGRLHYIRAALKWARKLRPDVIFCGHIFMLPLAILIGAMIQRPVWLQIHGIDAWKRPSRLNDWLVTRVTLVTSVSRHTRRRFLSWARIAPARVRVLPNTVSERFQPVDREQIRRALGIENRQVLLTIGRLAASEAYKGHDRVLRCLPELQRRFPRLLYLIAGSGDDQLRLEELAKQLKVAKSARFLGQVANEKLVELYSAADLFVMPSTGEGFGIAFLEAMACGTPALGLKGDGSGDPLRDGELGYVSFADGLCRTISSALDAQRPPDLAQQVRRWFGYEIFKARVARLVREDLVFPVAAGD